MNGGSGIGGLSEAALLMDASGRNVILLEAVGVGRAEAHFPSDEDSCPDPQVWVSGSWWW